MKWLLIGLALLGFMGLAFAQGQPTIIVQNADDMGTIGTTQSTTLETILGNVSPRFLLEHANDLAYFTLPTVDSTLNNHLGAIRPKYTILHANDNRRESLYYPHSIPDTFPQLEVVYLPLLALD